MAARVMTRLGRMNTTAAFLSAVVLVVAALIISGWVGAVILLSIGAALGYVLVRIWPALDGSGRTVRILSLTAVFALAVLQLFR